MGRKRNLDVSCRLNQNRRNVNMSSEEVLQRASMRLVSMPDLPIKVQRRIVKRTGKEGQCNPAARAVFFKKEIPLSPLYNKELSIPYIEQVFTSLKKIGQGSFGDVYEGRSLENKKRYAIKVTNDNHSLLNYGEVRRLENIPKHHHCVKYYGAWEQSYRIYIKMELCTSSLDKVLELNNNMKESEMWDVLVDISLGLQHLHRHNMIHLDVKPSNVMVTSTGVCKLGDFGLLFNLNEVDPLTSKKYRTGLSVSEGDGRYVAPEVLCDGTYTFFGDVYSFGLMMLEIAAQTRLPSSGREWENIRNEILPECYLKQDLSEDFRTLINRMIRRDYTKRVTIDDLLLSRGAQSVLIQHQHGIRNNFMVDWDTRWYIHSNKCNMESNSEEHINMSPPRQLQNSLGNIPPWSRMPLQSACRVNNGIAENPRFHIHKKVARKLF